MSASASQLQVTERSMIFWVTDTAPLSTWHLDEMNDVVERKRFGSKIGLILC